MISFHGDAQLKADLLIEIKKHEEADQIIQGSYGKQNGKWKGCAVGCSIRSYNLVRGRALSISDHRVYETEFGIPRIIARLEDRIFEGLTVADSKGFPYKFMSAIPVGIDLGPVWRKFLIWLLIDPTEGVIKYAKTDERPKVIQDVADLLARSLTEKISREQFLEVRRAADAAAAAAAYAAAYAAAAAAYAAAAAADAAAAAAAYAAAAAADAAAADAAYAAAAAAAYAAYADADRRQKFSKMADKLVELLSEAK